MRHQLCMYQLSITSNVVDFALIQFFTGMGKYIMLN